MQTYKILLSLLYENQRYAELFELYVEILKHLELYELFPEQTINCLVFAACYHLVNVAHLDTSNENVNWIQMFIDKKCVILHVSRIHPSIFNMLKIYFSVQSICMEWIVQRICWLD